MENEMTYEEYLEFKNISYVTLNSFNIEEDKFIEVLKADWVFSGLKGCEMILIEAINTNQIIILT